MFWPLMKNTINYVDKFRMIKFILTTKQFTMGKMVKQFEDNWNKWLGSKYSLFVSSGSTANTLLIASVKELYNLKDNDKVLVPACTWSTNISPIFQCGLQPIFCDINFENFSFDLDDAEQIAKSHPDIKVIFVSHLLGFPGQNSQLQKLFPQAILIDDICESHGCLDDIGQKHGSNTVGATFSFYFGHHMTTIEGGMVSTNNLDLYDLMSMKRNHGLSRVSIYKQKYADLYNKIDPLFLFATDGYNFRNHDLCATLGLSQLSRLDNTITARKSNHKKFVNILNQYTKLFYTQNYDMNASSFCFPIICKSERISSELKKLLSNNGIEYRPIVGGNLLEQPFLQNRNYKIETSKNISNVEIMNKQGLYIGNNQFLKEKHFDKLDDVFYELAVKTSI